MAAMEKYDRLEEVWKTIHNKDVYKKYNIIINAIRLLFGAKSIYNNNPLWKLLNDEVKLEDITKKLMVGVVSLSSGNYYNLTPETKNFKKAVLASTVIPIAFSPVDINMEYLDVVDGGVRNITPLGDVIDNDPSKIIIINCGRADMGSRDHTRNVIEIAMRTVDIMLNEIFVNDVKEFLNINALVKLAEEANLTLKKSDGTPYKYFESILIEPSVSLGSTLEFNPEENLRRFNHGYNRAKEVIQNG